MHAHQVSGSSSDSIFESYFHDNQTQENEPESSQQNDIAKQADSDDPEFGLDDREVDEWEDTDSEPQGLDGAPDSSEDGFEYI
jgi:hypothetical protein